jgi:predicted metalloprotease
MQRECPSKRTYVATTNGRYISTSDVEDEDIAAANIIGDDTDQEMSDEEILDAYATEHYRTAIVQRSLSAQVDHADKIQCTTCFTSSLSSMIVVLSPSSMAVAATTW